MENTIQENLSLQNETIHRIYPKKTYENSELIGIKILNVKEFVDLFNDGLSIL